MTPNILHILLDSVSRKVFFLRTPHLSKFLREMRNGTNSENPYSKTHKSFLFTKFNTVGTDTVTNLIPTLAGCGIQNDEIESTFII